MKDRKKILMIGSLPPPLGGTTILLDLLLKELHTMPDLKVYHIDTNLRGRYGFIFLPWIIIQVVFRSIPVSVISMHASPVGIIMSSPLLWLISRIFNKKLIFRLFGGNFDEYFRNGNMLFRFIIRNFTMKCDLLLLETRQLVNYFGALHKNVLWFPNHRRKNLNLPSTARDFQKIRAVYISHVRIEKGIMDLIAAVEGIENLSLDVYGPFFDGLNESIFSNTCIDYKGILTPVEVEKVIPDYDILLLPSYREGYPGIIIEALSAGLAIVCTNLISLREMLLEDVDALMFSPGDISALRQAIILLTKDKKTLQKLKLNSQAKFGEYNSYIWSRNFAKYCSEL